MIWSELLGILGELGQLGADLGGARVVLRVAVLVDHGLEGGKLSLESLDLLVDAGGHLIGAVAGLYPAIRAARTPPTAALASQ